MLKNAILTLLFLFFFALELNAAPILSVGDYVTSPGDVQIDISLTQTADEPLDFFGFRLEISPQDGGVVYPDPVSFTSGNAIDSSTGLWLEVIRNSDTRITATHGVLVGTPVDYIDGIILSLTLSALQPGLYDLNFLDVEFGKGYDAKSIEILNGSINVIPIPGAVWLLGSGLIGLVGIRRRFLS